MPARQPVLGFALRDGTGTAGTCRFNLHTGTGVVAGHAAGDDLRGKLESITGCSFVRQTVVYPFTYESPDPPLPGSRVESRAALIFETSAAGQLLVISIPAIRPALIRQDGPNAGVELDSSAGPIIDFVQQLVTGVWCNPFGYDVIDLAATVVETVE